MRLESGRRSPPTARKRVMSSPAPERTDVAATKEALRDY
jgi:hypothetical protein